LGVLEDSDLQIIWTRVSHTTEGVEREMLKVKKGKIQLLSRKTRNLKSGQVRLCYLQISDGIGGKNT